MIDDDLPVLTQVLRTGTVRQSALPEAKPADAPLLADPLVIGEPHRGISAYLAPTGPVSTDDRVVPDVAGDDSPRDGGATMRHVPDAILLPQDHDVGVTGRPSALAVPTLDASTPFPATVAATPAEEPAVLARRIRDAVVDDLRTRIDTELDARIAQALHAAVETVLARLQESLRAHLSDALRDVVAKAVAETIAGRSDGDRPVA